MGRLIDYDVLLKDVQNTITAQSDTMDWLNMISRQPTAFDAGKVVAELEHFAKLAEDRWANGTSNHAYQEHKCWVKAIGIVKRGGVK